MSEFLSRLTKAYESGPDDGFFCGCCGESYDCNPESEPSVLCNACAQQAADEIPAMMAVLATTTERLRKAEAECAAMKSSNHQTYRVKEYRGEYRWGLSNLDVFHTDVLSLQRVEDGGEYGVFGFKVPREDKRHEKHGGFNFSVRIPMAMVVLVAASPAPDEVD